MQDNNVSRIFNFAVDQITEGTNWGLSLDKAISGKDFNQLLKILQEGLPAHFGSPDKQALDMAAEQLLGAPQFQRKVKTPPNRSSLDPGKVRKVMREVMSSHLSSK